MWNGETGMKRAGERAWEPWCMDWVKVSGVRGVERGMHGENMNID